MDKIEQARNKQKDELEQEIGQELNQIWERSKSPLEKWWDGLVSGGNWEEERPAAHFKIYSWNDVIWRGRVVVAGQPFACHLLTGGRLTRWNLRPLYASMNRLTSGVERYAKYRLSLNA